MKNRGGRPKESTKLTENIIAELRQYLLQDYQIKDACKIVGVSYSSFYNWRKLGKEKKRGIYRRFYRAINPIFEEKQRRWLDKCRIHTEKVLARLERRNAQIERYLTR